MEPESQIIGLTVTAGIAFGCFLALGGLVYRWDAVMASLGL